LIDYFENKNLLKKEHGFSFDEIESMVYYEYEMLIQWLNSYIERNETETSGKKEVLKLTKNN
jgi:hypothetical protein